MSDKKGVLSDISKVKVNFDFDIPIVYFFGGWLVLGVIISLAIYMSSQKDQISRIVEAATFFLLLAGGGLVAISTYCQWKTVFVGVKQTEYQICRDKIDSAMEFGAIWNSECMDKERTHYRELRLLRKTKSDQDMVFLINKNPDYRDTICDIANFFESLSTAINSGKADEDILASGFKPLLQSVKQTYDPWFKDLEQNDPGYHGQFKPFFDLLERWR